MKTMIKLPAVLLGLLLLLTGASQRVMAQNDDISLQSFYDELSPYGQWINDPQYGYVWRPDVDQEEFRPYYTNGRWVMTEYGNTWVSNYDWGWAPFHYGRWIYNRYNQWVWIPDTVWGPAWVSWRSGGGYYGWAPLGPSISIGINIGRGGYRIPDMCWNFIPYNNIYYNSFPRYYGNRNRVYIQNTVIINNTYVRNNRTYYSGPRIDDIRRHTNQNVNVYNVTRTNRAGASRIENNSVNIYNPRPSRGNSNGNVGPRDAIQGSINRGPIASRGTENNDRRSNDIYNNRGTGRNESINTRPTRESNGVDRVQPGRDMGNRNENNRTVPQRVERSREAFPQNQVQQRGERPQNIERGDRVQVQPQRNIDAPQPQRNERMSQPQQPQRVERSAPQRMERSAPQRVEQPAPQRVERSAPQRVERSAPQQRTERSAPQRGNGGNENRGGGGRVRGGN